MRQIKFRAWDKFNECFWWSSESATLCDFFHKVEQLKNGGNEIVIQECTGRIDKNYTEIYEGDIFRVEEDAQELDEQDLIYYLVVVWVKEWCMFCTLRVSDEYQAYLREGITALDEPMFWTYTLEDTDSQKFYLCGNVYQNPELL